jgi:hypothetical protein
MNNKVLKVFVISLLLSGLLGVMALASGAQTVSPVPPSGSEEPFQQPYQQPSQQQFQLPPQQPPQQPSPQERDPEFWKLWESAHGLG